MLWTNTQCTRFSLGVCGHFFFFLYILVGTKCPQYLTADLMEAFDWSTWGKWLALQLLFEGLSNYSETYVSARLSAGCQDKVCESLEWFHNSTGFFLNENKTTNAPSRPSLVSFSKQNWPRLSQTTEKTHNRQINIEDQRRPLSPLQFITLKQHLHPLNSPRSCPFYCPFNTLI